MTSPFVRRNRLAIELRALREQRGMTAEDLSKQIFRSRMTISKLENARCRPQIGDVLKILDALGVEDDEWRRILGIARDAAERGWWDAFGDAMGARQRMYADIESGADTIREYNQFTIPGFLQTPDFIEFIIEMALAEGESSFTPDRLFEARLRRQEQILGRSGPRYEVILDELLIRRPTAPAPVMLRQLRSVIDVAQTHPRITVLVLPLVADFTGRLLPKSAFFLYTFPDPADPPMVVVDTVSADIVHTTDKEFMRYNQRYEHLRQASLSGAASLGLLIDAADALENGMTSSP
ncbi:helix-turn-helix domain-containing protein [Spirillospora albida]|uniref:helix-turn-helix domain-containing protein n=1 Tax=Spirillospora albida TaxID=58123 RepID=UPI0004C18642|nr:helix-turn-helix transcriptional regulator [Spirillospora albida]